LERACASALGIERDKGTDSLRGLGIDGGMGKRLSTGSGFRRSSRVYVCLLCVQLQANSQK
jgi:hypothetical protein